MVIDMINLFYIYIYISTNKQTYLFTPTQKHTHIYIYTYIWVYTYIYAHTYIHHGHIWHRNKFSSCQLEPLVSCSSDEHHTSLKWDRSSYPVAPECRVSHTLRLKYIITNASKTFQQCRLTFKIAATVQAIGIARYWLPKISSRL